MSKSTIDLHGNRLQRCCSRKLLKMGKVLQFETVWLVVFAFGLLTFRGVDADADDDVNVRLFGGDFSWEGRAQYKADGTWGEICHHHLRSRHLRWGWVLVFCHELGYTGALAADYADETEYGAGDSDSEHTMYNPECGRWADSMDYCRHEDEGCSHDEDIVISCDFDRAIGSPCTSLSAGDCASDVDNSHCDLETKECVCDEDYTASGDNTQCVELGENWYIDGIDIIVVATTVETTSVATTKETISIATTEETTSVATTEETTNVATTEMTTSAAITERTTSATRIGTTDVITSTAATEVTTVTVAGDTTIVPVSPSLTEVIQFLIITNDSPKQVGEPVWFTVYIGYISSDMNISLTFGDDDHYVFSYSSFQNESMIQDQYSFSATALHNYTSLGEFEATVTVMDMDGNLVNESTVVFVQAVPCDLPVVTIDGGGATREEAVQFLQSQGILLMASVELDCSAADMGTFLWTVHAMGDSDVAASDANKVTLPSDIETHTATLSLPERALDVDAYIIQFTVTIITDSNSGSYVMGVNQTWIEIIHSSLVAAIAGGSARKVGSDSDLVLDAGSSQDPDLSPEEDQGLTFNWFCHLAEDNIQANLTALLGGLEDGQGCFGYGYSLITDPGHDATVTISSYNLTLLDLPVNLVFLVWVSKEGRDDVYTEQTVSVVMGDPPLLEISCTMNCQSSMNPSQKLILRSWCTNCGSRESLTYNWTFVPASGDNLKQTLDWNTETLTGRYGENLVVIAGTFSSVQEEQSMLSVVGIRDSDGATGYAEYSFWSNTAPSVGTCEVSPTEGTVLETLFIISCEDFSDMNTPLVYKFYAVQSGSNEKSLLYHGYSASSQPMYLPLGNSDMEYLLGLVVKVEDSYGAGVEVNLNVTVTEAEEVDFTALQNLTSGQDSPLQQLLSAGDDQKATQLISTVSSLLNKQSADAPEDTDDEAKQERMEMRETLVNSLASVTVQSMDSLQQASSAIVEVTQESGELTGKAGTKAAGALMAMSSFLETQTASEDIDAEALDESARLIVSGLSNVLTAFKPEENGTIEAQDNVVETGDSRDLKRNATLQTMASLDSVKAALIISKVPGESATVVQTNSLIVQLSRDYGASLDNFNLEINTEEASPSKFKFPTGFSSQVFNGSTEVDTEVVQFNHNPFSWTDQDDPVTSAVADLVLKVSASEVNVEDLDQPIDIYLPASPNQEEPISITLRAESLAVIEFTPASNDSGTQVFVNITDWMVDAENVSLRLNIMSVADQASNTSLSLGDVTNGPIENFTTLITWTHIYENDTASATVTPRLILQPLEVKLHYLTLELVYMPNSTTDGEVSANVSITESTCNFWNTVSETWSSEGCQVGTKSTLSVVHCQCTHLTSFGAGLFVKPNKLNLMEDLAKFLEFWKNPVAIIFVCCVMGIYTFGIVWARRKDRLDLEKAFHVDLPDNDPLAHHKYVVTIFTGSRRGSGTSANVTMVLIGEESKSEPHVLQPEGWKACQRGAVDTFLVCTHRHLGRMKAIRFWHDNSGDSPNWFVSRVIVQDMTEDTTHYIVCDSWLGVDVGNGAIDQRFAVTSEEDLKQFGHLFLTHSSKGLRDKHLWMSIFARPAYSSFTRVQRISCCLSLFMCFMLGNIMFYGISPEASEERMDMGPFTITWTEIRIGVQTSIVIFPVNLMIVQLFRLSGRRPVKTATKKTKSPLTERASKLTVESHKSNHGESHTNSLPENTSRKNSVDDNLDVMCFLDGIKLQETGSDTSSMEKFACNTSKHSLRRETENNHQLPESETNKTPESKLQLPGTSKTRFESIQELGLQHDGFKSCEAVQLPSFKHNQHSRLYQLQQEGQESFVSIMEDNEYASTVDLQQHSVFSIQEAPEDSEMSENLQNDEINENTCLAAETSRENEQIVDNSQQASGCTQTLEGNVMAETFFQDMEYSVLYDNFQAQKEVPLHSQSSMQDTLDDGEDARLKPVGAQQLSSPGIMQGKDDEGPSDLCHQRSNHSDPKPHLKSSESSTSHLTSLGSLDSSVSKLSSTKTVQTLPSKSTCSDVKSLQSFASEQHSDDLTGSNSLTHGHEALHFKSFISQTNMGDTSTAVVDQNAVPSSSSASEEVELDNVHLIDVENKSLASEQVDEIASMRHLLKEIKDSLASGLSKPTTYDKHDVFDMTSKIKRQRSMPAKVIRHTRIAAKVKVKNNAQSMPYIKLQQDCRAGTLSNGNCDKDSLLPCEGDDIDDEVELVDKEHKQRMKSHGRKRSCQLPWWCVFIAWALVVLVTLVCAFFTILYSFNYGQYRSFQWLKSMLVSFIQDALFLQPLKVIGLAFFVSAILKKVDKDYEPFSLSTSDLGEEYEDISDAAERQEQVQELRRANSNFYSPPKMDILHVSRENRLQEERMYNILREIAGYAVFLWLILLLAYGVRDKQMYFTNSVLHGIFFNTDQYKSVSGMTSLWRWADDQMLEALYGGTEEKFLLNEVSILVDSPRLRQVRVTQDECEHVLILSDIKCLHSYKEGHMEQADFDQSWSIVAEDGICNKTAWCYQDSVTSRGYPVRGVVTYYPAGGYVAELGMDKNKTKEVLQELKDRQWIDEHTRLVILEVVTYNVNTNLLSVILAMFEFTQFGGPFKTEIVQSMRLYRATSSMHVFVLICEILYCLYTMVFLVMEVKKIIQLKWSYFLSLWNWLDLSVILTSLAAIVVYALHAAEMQKLIQTYQTGESGHSFHKAFVLDSAMAILIGIIVMLATIKFIHLLRFNPKIFLFSATLRRTTGNVATWVIIFGVVFMACASLVNLLMGACVQWFRNLITTLWSLTDPIYYDPEVVHMFHPILGPAILLLFSFISLSIFVNLLVALLMDSLEEVEKKPLPNDDAEFLEHLLERVRHWLALKKDSL